MDVKAAVAAVPVARRAWRIVPGPLRLPLVVGAVGLWLWRRRREPDDEQTAREQP